MRIAVLAPNKPFWGARIVQIPFLRALREQHPDAVIRVHSPVDETADFVDWGLADEHRTYGRHSLYRLPTDIWKWWPDLVVNLRRKSLGCNWGTAIAPRRRVGYAEGLLSRSYSVRVRYDSTVYLASRYIALASGATEDVDGRSIPLFRHWMKDRIGDAPAGGGGIVLMPGAGNLPKRWPLENFVQLAGILRRETGERVTFVLGPAEGAESARLAADPAVTVVDTPSLDDLLRRVESASLVIANDNGPSHLAQLSGRRFLGLYRAGYSTVEDWFLDKTNSDLLVSERGEALDTVTVDRAAAAARGLLATAELELAFGRFSRAEAARPRAR